MQPLRWITTAVSALALLGVLTGTAAQAGSASTSPLRRFGAKVEINSDNQDHIRAAGAQVIVKGAVVDDVWLLGADVEVGAGIGGHALLAGSEVTVGGKIGRDLDIWAAHAKVSAIVGDDLVVRAADVEVTQEAVINDDTHLFASRARFEGTSLSKLEIHADEVVIAGTVKGNAELVGASVRFEPGTNISGDVTVWTIGEPVVVEGARISGRIVRRGLTDMESMGAFLEDGPLTRLAPAVLLGASGLFCGLFFLWFGRAGVEQTIDELVDSPIQSGLWGLATLIVLPLSALVLGFTIFGIPLGTFSMLALPLLVLLGYASAGFGLGEWMLNRLGEPKSSGARAMLLLAGLVVLAALSLIPYVGWPILGIAALCGLGAFLRTLYERMRGNAIGRSTGFY